MNSMQYALEKAIEKIYNIEPVEIDARLMGSEEFKNIMLYESDEGSIGVLKGHCSRILGKASGIYF